MTLFPRFVSALVCCLVAVAAVAQVNTDQVIKIGRNSLYFEDYILAIQYFNQAIAAKPYLAQPYFYRGVAKFDLEDFRGAEQDATMALERNPFLTDAYELRGVARQNLGKTEAAIADYDKALEGFPMNRNLLFNKAMAQNDVKDYQGATATFQTLLEAYPGYEGGYMGRARVALSRKTDADTVAALADLDKVIEINKNSVAAYLVRADLRTRRGPDYKGALADLEQAIKLQPLEADFYMNRAYVKYLDDDLAGAMDDFNHTLQLDPGNAVALLNRGMLRAEVHDTNNAIADFTKVLEQNPDDYKTLYNRAILLADVGDYRHALRDMERVVAAYPDFAAARFLLFDIKRQAGDTRGAQRDYEKSLALAHKGVTTFPDDGASGAQADQRREMTQEQVKRMFTTLTASNADVPEALAFNNTDIRGRVQDRKAPVELLPAMSLTYYTSPTELKPGGEYVKEAEQLNATRQLRYLLQVACQVPMATEEAVKGHFESIDYYNSLLAAQAPRALDYFARAMDFITVRDYAAAVADLTRAVALTPDFTLAYLARAQALTAQASSEPKGGKTLPQPGAPALGAALADLETVARLSPRMPVAHYNLGVLLARGGDAQAAIDAFTRAIELKPDFGEAYYNRGYERLSRGDRAGALADIGKAGELGVLQSYSLLKRISR